MALIKCKECGKDISSEAKVCPSCGIAPPKRTGIVSIVVVGLIGIYMVKCTYDEASKGPPPQKSADTIQADKELNVAIAYGKLIKKATKDPSSFKMESFLIYPGGAACYEYRAKNSFGAIVPAKAVFDGTTLTTSETDRSKFAKSWNAVCTKAGGEERAGGLNLLGVW